MSDPQVRLLTRPLRPLTGPSDGPQTYDPVIETLWTFRLYIDQQRIVKDIHYKLDDIYETILELDSHADTCVLGHGALITLDYNRPVSIVGYDMSPLEVRLTRL
jgi:hypothetical protein